MWTSKVEWKQPLDFHIFIFTSLWKQYMFYCIKAIIKIVKKILKIPICKSKNRQHNDQTKKYKRTNNYLQNIHVKHGDLLSIIGTVHPVWQTYE
jgi:hypothetical protein